MTGTKRSRDAFNSVYDEPPLKRPFIDIDRAIDACDFSDTRAVLELEYTLEDNPISTMSACHILLKKLALYAENQQKEDILNTVYHQFARQAFLFFEKIVLENNQWNSSFQDWIQEKIRRSRAETIAFLVYNCGELSGSFNVPALSAKMFNAVINVFISLEPDVRSMGFFFKGLMLLSKNHTIQGEVDVAVLFRKASVLESLPLQLIEKSLACVNSLIQSDNLQGIISADVFESLFKKINPFYYINSVETNLISKQKIVRGLYHLAKNCKLDGQVVFPENDIFCAINNKNKKVLNELLGSPESPYFSANDEMVAEFFDIKAPRLLALMMESESWYFISLLRACSSSMRFALLTSTPLELLLTHLPLTELELFVSGKSTATDGSPLPLYCDPISMGFLIKTLAGRTKESQEEKERVYALQINAIDSAIEYHRDDDKVISELSKLKNRFIIQKQQDYCSFFGKKIIQDGASVQNGSLISKGPL